jgi:hypothetical protein
VHFAVLAPLAALQEHARQYSRFPAPAIEGRSPLHALWQNLIPSNQPLGTHHTAKKTEISAE